MNYYLIEPCATRDRHNELTAINLADVRRPTFLARNLRYQAASEATRKCQKNVNCLAEKPQKTKTLSQIFLSSDTPTVNLNCANFHRFSPLAA